MVCSRRVSCFVLDDIRHDVGRDSYGIFGRDNAFFKPYCPATHETA